MLQQAALFLLLADNEILLLALGLQVRRIIKSSSLFSANSLFSPIIVSGYPLYPVKQVRYCFSNTIFFFSVLCCCCSQSLIFCLMYSS